MTTRNIVINATQGHRHDSKTDNYQRVTRQFSHERCRSYGDVRANELLFSFIDQYAGTSFVHIRSNVFESYFHARREVHAVNELSG